MTYMEIPQRYQPTKTYQVSKLPAQATNYQQKSRNQYNQATNTTNATS